MKEFIDRLREDESRWYADFNPLGLLADSLFPQIVDLPDDDVL